jgi:Mn-dependent DtxR family transcriptional regulator
MQVGMIPDEPAAFIQMMSKPIMRMELATPPTRRRARNKGVVSMTPRRSIRLDKKVAHRMPTVITTQNLLMRKLGLISSSELKPDYLEHYAKIFAEGLTEEKVRMIDELFMDYVPATEAAEVLVDEEV